MTNSPKPRPAHCPFLNRFLKCPCFRIFVSALTWLIIFLGFITSTAYPISSFPLTYCVCFSFLAVAAGWKVHRHSHWLRNGQQTPPHSSGAWAKWVWKGEMVGWGVALLLTSCHTGRDSVHTALWIQRQGRVTSVCCVASFGGGQGGRWCVPTVKDWFDWAAVSSILAADAGLWSEGGRDAVRGPGKTTRCETPVRGSDTLLRVWEGGFRQLTGPGGGSHNPGRNTLCCLKGRKKESDSSWS